MRAVNGTLVPEDLVVVRDWCEVVAKALAPRSICRKIAPSLQSGHLRFKFAMVKAMLALYRQSNFSLISTPVGSVRCRPQWVQLVSDSCAPVARCGDFHRVGKMA